MWLVGGKSMTSNTVWVKQLFSHFLDVTNVDIVFEEKEVLKKTSPVINISIHPIRFADDVFFNFETNDAEIRKKLFEYEVNYNSFYVQADLVKASCLKLKRKLRIKQKALLLVGQTEADKVIYDGKKYLNLIDFLPEIEALSREHEAIYFKPHPYAKNTKSIFRSLRNCLGNVAITHGNIYQLLSHDNIVSVAGLNSSVLYEAKYFKKKTKFLYRPYFDFKAKDIGVYGDYFNSPFWSDVLGIEDKKASLPFVSNRLRRALNDFWGYSYISDEIDFRNMIKAKFLERRKFKF